MTNQVQHKELRPVFYRSLFNKTRKFLKENENIILTRSDKGNVTVVMNRDHYQHLANEMITNDTSYVLIRSDPTLSIQAKCNSTSSTLKNGGMLGQIRDREWLDSDAALSQHHITQGSSVVDFRITQEPDDSQHYNGLPVMQ
ncbi:hypothetical protein WA026_020831 [Henosepilachna vigintioctopunctata]|uniref:Uncharacterized protein n=1 Tax=Henosepilachna vigintioctopunctata TaxID=420089 RepID=A0AAW1TNK6_9CUCU